MHKRQRSNSCDESKSRTKIKIVRQENGPIRDKWNREAKKTHSYMAAVPKE